MPTKFDLFPAIQVDGTYYANHVTFQLAPVFGLATAASMAADVAAAYEQSVIDALTALSGDGRWTAWAVLGAIQDRASAKGFGVFISPFTPEDMTSGGPSPDFLNSFAAPTDVA